MAVTNQQVAPKYATALYEAAVDAKNVATVQADLAAINTILAANTQFLTLLQTHVVAEADVPSLLDTLTTGAAELTQRFVRLLFDYGRISALPVVIAAFNRTVATAAGELDATATTAVALTPAQSAQISTAVAAKFGVTTVNLTNAVDPSVIGGVRIAANNRIIDGTVATRLSKLRAAMLAN